MAWLGVRLPISSAASAMKGLKVEPGWRCACVARFSAPAVSGHPVFERYYRVQMNTLEQLIVFIPAVFLFGYYGHALVAAALGAVYLVGRSLFARSYVADPAKRSLGFMLSYLPTLVLLIGGLVQAVRSL